MRSEIYAKLNKQHSLDDLRCLSEVPTEKEQESCLEMGYVFGFTSKTWSEEFPEIDPKYVYCSKSVIMPSELYYFDAEHYICFPMRIYNGETYLYGEYLREKLPLIIESLEADSRNKEYYKLLLPIASEESGNLAMGILRLMLENEEPSPELYKAAINVYTICNCGAQKLGKKAIENLIRCKSAEQRERTAAALSGFGEEITIYRGEGSESTPYRESLSWTTDLGRALFFAAWRENDDVRVYEGKVRKADVIEYITDRKESEIITLPQKVQNVTQFHCISMETYRELVSPVMFNTRRRFPQATVAQEIIDKVREIYQTVDVEDHALEHSIRVALHSSFLYRLDVLVPLRSAPIERFRKALPAYEALILAAEYHDAGRLDNEPDEIHGLAGYERYLADGNPENETVKFLAEYHCKSDDAARDYWEKHFAGEDKDFIWTAFEIIRDADALDRVRFGSLSDDFLDVGLLRRTSSKRLVPVAMQLEQMRFE